MNPITRWNEYAWHAVDAALITALIYFVYILLDWIFP